MLLRKVSVPMTEPFRISNGEVSVKDSIVIEFRAKGLRGFGEASAMAGSFYSAETPESTWKALKHDLVPDLLTRTITSPVEYARMLNAYGKEPFARAGMEGAMWDLTAQLLGTDIKSLIAPGTGPVYSGLALGLYDTVEELLERIEELYPRGYQRLKIKIQPAWDVEPLSKIRERFGNIPLMVDANQAYTLSEHVRTLHDLDKFELLMIEQPLARDAYIEHAYLASELKTPICADESAEDMHGLAQILYHRSAQIINIKVQRVGGLWHAREMHDRARGAGLQCWLGTMPELGIASAQALTLAGLPGMVYPTDIEESVRWYVDDIVSPAIEITPSGTFAHSPAEHRVDEAKLDRFTSQIEVISR